MTDEEFKTILKKGLEESFNEGAKVCGQAILKMLDQACGLTRDRKLDRAQIRMMIERFLSK